MIVRRLSDLGYVTQVFYNSKRVLFEAEPKRPSGKPTYYTKTNSQLGKPLIRGIMSANNERALTANEAAAYLRVKVEHLGKLLEKAA
jgi:hypothetical protein